MYSACLFCHASLGANDVLETFPVGRRLAFDPARGRLWVVCPACARWNLTPLEERWEAIERAERLHAATRLRVGGEHVSLARVGRDTELIRIGGPTRTELATWRYGDAFRRRRTRNLLLAGTIVGVGGVAIAGGLAAGGVAVVTAVQLAMLVNGFARFGNPARTVTRIRRPGRGLLAVSATQLRWSFLGCDADGGLLLQLGVSKGGMGDTPIVVAGDDAVAALRKMLPAVNRMGGTRTEIEGALARMTDAGTPERLLARVARDGAALTRRDEDRGLLRQVADEMVLRPTGLAAMPPAVRLALEMALHEDVERRALEGELAVLEAAWKEAEEIAKLADGMFLPAAVEAELERMRGRAGGVDA